AAVQAAEAMAPAMGMEALNPITEEAKGRAARTPRTAPPTTAGVKTNTAMEMPRPAVHLAIPAQMDTPSMFHFLGSEDAAAEVNLFTLQLPTTRLNEPVASSRR